MEAWLSTRVALWRSGRRRERERENEEKESVRGREEESDVKRWWSWG